MQDLLHRIGDWPTVAIGVLVILAILGVIWRRHVAAFFSGLTTAFGWLVVLLLWAFPPIIAGVGWLFPALHQTISFPVPSEVLGAMWVPALFGLAWFAWQWSVAQDANTNYRTLQLDLMVSIIWALIFVAIAAHQFALKNLQWWVVIPAIFTTLEALLNARSAVNNAFQKNPTQMQKGE